MATLHSVIVGKKWMVSGSGALGTGPAIWQAENIILGLCITYA